MGVTKTDFMRGMQCPKMLWLDKHKPQEKVIPPEIQQKLDEGNDFGDRAMSIFGEYVEVTTRNENGFLDFKGMIEKTKDCLESGVNVICEGSFTCYGHFCSADILRKVGSRYELYEVKNALELKEQFIKDIAFQKYLIVRCGVKIQDSFVILNDGNDGFKIEKVTDRVKAYEKWVDENIWRLGKIKFQKEEVETPMGEHCQTPYECWYLGYCKRKLEN
ncbi:MAG: hypothetical protein IJF64_03625 [Clostridia bacterium]|nr:hypothetical protein [Clostridia bacterium]